MNIDGLGENTMEDFYNMKFIMNIMDIYNINKVISIMKDNIKSRFSSKGKKIIDITNKVLENYKSQKNVIRKSGNSRLNYGKIVGLQDMDPD
jgi:NAD-dependent DNA ligase